MAEIISLVVVFPALPVNPTIFPLNNARFNSATFPSACTVSFTCSWGMGTAVLEFSTSAATAPDCSTAGKKSCASKRSPLSTTKRSPDFTFLLSVQTPEKHTSLPDHSVLHARATADNVIVCIMQHHPPRLCAAQPAQNALVQHLKMEIFFHLSLDNFHVLYLPATPHPPHRHC